MLKSKLYFHYPENWHLHVSRFVYVGHVTSVVKMDHYDWTEEKMEYTDMYIFLQVIKEKYLTAILDRVVLILYCHF